MSKEIKSLKSQLKDLAEVLNGFESEFVQLKVLKMLTKSGYLDIVTDKKGKSGKPEEETTRTEQKSGKEGKRKKESKKAEESSTELNVLEYANNQIEKTDSQIQVIEKPNATTSVTVKPGRKKVEKAVNPEVSKKSEKTVKTAKAVKTTTKAVKPAAKTTKSGSGKRATGEQPKAKGKPGRPTVADRPGPTSVLNALVETGFFDEARSIGAIIEHCNKAQGWILKSTDISGILLGLVRKNLLIRRKNETTDKYEYIKA